MDNSVLYYREFYSQEGEDAVLARVFEGKKNRFYIDVGAHHPRRFSNTYFFYKKGWHGINIDAMPDSMQIFEEDRPLDINLEIPVSDRDEVLTYYIFNEPALNGFSKELSDSRNGLRQYKIINTKELRTRTLASILDEFMPAEQQIDFLSIDVEGLDFQVLNSNNWDKYRPEVVLVEALGGADVADILVCETNLFMETKGYSLFAKTFNTLFFKKRV
ncbi:MAG: FkbM family methyltransferase [Campylobacterales bacterium]|nr:FkbM family methyltransferase [Campylobacterales bacterium]